MTFFDKSDTLNLQKNRALITTSRLILQRIVPVSSWWPPPSPWRPRCHLWRGSCRRWCQTWPATGRDPRRTAPCACTGSRRGCTRGCRSRGAPTGLCMRGCRSARKWWCQIESLRRNFRIISWISDFSIPSQNIPQECEEFAEIIDQLTCCIYLIDENSVGVLVEKSVLKFFDDFIKNNATCYTANEVYVSVIINNKYPN